MNKNSLPSDLLEFQKDNPSVNPSSLLSEMVSRQRNHAHSFIAAGVACYAISLFDELGLIEKLIVKGYLNDKDLSAFPNRLVMKSAIITLQKNGVLEKGPKGYCPTEFGHQLLECRGSIGLIYAGYRNVLANQKRYALDEFPPLEKPIDFKAVANSSIYFGEKTIDPVVIDLLLKLDIKGKICDLGCGAGTRLKKICGALNNSGLGIELSNQAIKLAKKNVKGMPISINQGNVENLIDIWTGIEVIMQFFVMHDITPSDKCLNIINSFVTHFPDLKYFLYTDIVAPSQSIPNQLPGFDYVHSLLGIQTRTYEETLHLFRRSMFEVANEIYIEGLSNTFLWVLKRK